jgi:predicted regulator of Ras-like GTPase activity (Roadblock/LC7/MglB family)
VRELNVAGLSSSLSALASTEGVRGSVIFDGSGMVVATDLPPPYEPVLMAEVVKRLAGAFDVFTSLEESAVSGLFAHCDGGGLLMRKVEPHTLVVLTKPEVNVNLLNVALNVLALNLAREATNDSAASRSNMSLPMGVQSSHMLSQSGAAPGEIIPPDAVGKATVMRLLNVFTEYMGPAAKVVLKQQLAALGVSSRTLRHAQYNDLVGRLASKLPSGPRQGQFTEAARRLHD